MSEQERFDFVRDRDGLKEARAWALRTYRIYRQALYGPPHWAQTKYWRHKFVRSLLELRAILRAQRMFRRCRNS